MKNFMTHLIFLALTSPVGAQEIQAPKPKERSLIINPVYRPHIDNRRDDEGPSLERPCYRWEKRKSRHRGNTLLTTINRRKYPCSKNEGRQLDPESLFCALAIKTPFVKENQEKGGEPYQCYLDLICD